MDNPISRIRRAPEIIQRYRHILTVLARYGLAHWLDQLPLGFAKDILARGVGEELLEESTEGRVRRALGELGPIFIKLGQLAGNRPDIVGVALAKELQGLQDRAPSDERQAVEAVLAESLGQPPQEVFAEFDWEPLASASIAQVHRAGLKTGEEVVVKVQHSGLEQLVENDVSILSDLAELLEHYVSESRPFRPRAMVDEFRRGLMRELDFRRELHNMEAFRKNFEGDPILCIPTTYPEYSSGRVLTMERLKGIKFTETETLRNRGIDPVETAREGARIFLEMIFEHGLFHSDPHPGNFLLLDEGRIGLLDFGQVGRVDEDLRRDLEDILLGVAQKDARRIGHAFSRMGATPTDLDRPRFHGDINTLLGYYTDVPLGQIHLASAIRELLELVRKHRIVLPPDLALLLTVIVALEGTGRQLDPNFRLMDLVAPYQSKIALRRYSPARQFRKMQKIGQDLERLMETAPAALSEVARQLEDGKFTLQLRVEEIDQARHQLEKSTNRITFGILTASIILASSLLLFKEVPPVIYGYSALGLAGYGLSLFLALRLIWAIYRSGKLN